MKIPNNFTQMKRGISRWTLGMAAAAGLLALTTGVYADPPVTMAPPLQTNDAQGAPSGENVFNWTETPQNQDVVITRAVFDQGGYQLFDTQGETIVVPFTNQNLYVMKFARSTTGQMYFVNEGDAPVLYVPRHGYLENATVPGARWYPFPKKFHPAAPIYLGIAPSWHAYVGMGWYPSMAFWGGYYSSSPFMSGVVFGPTFGLFIQIGGQQYHGFAAYHSYYRANPAPYRVGFFHQNVYRFANHSSLREFGGGSHTYQAHRAFQGAGGSFNGHRGFRGAGGSTNGRHTFQGGGDQSVYAHRTFQGAHQQVYQPNAKGGNGRSGHNRDNHDDHHDDHHDR